MGSQPEWYGEIPVDTGCSESPRCQTCPLKRCREDDLDGFVVLGVARRIRDTVKYFGGRIPDGMTEVKIEAIGDDWGGLTNRAVRRRMQKARSGWLWAQSIINRWE